jgi:hypothetical protein
MKTFWTILFFLILIWYLLVSILVAVRGLGNIKVMLKNLQDEA